MKSSILKLLSLIFLSLNLGCSSVKYDKTVDQVDLKRFMGKWYVIAGRFTSFEDGAHNAIEDYTWNDKEERIDIDFNYREDSFNGEYKSIPQKAFIFNKTTNAHWKVQPFWPLKFDYFVIALDKEYKWTAIGVPSTKYLWIMHRDWNISKEQLAEMTEAVKNAGYPITDLERLPQKW